MTEKILNSDFSSGTYQYTIDNWNNGVNEYQYQWSAPPEVYAGYAGFVADPNREFDMNQAFSSNYEVVSAKLALRAKWNVPEGDIEDGYLRYLIELEKPDTSRVTLYDEVKPTNSPFGGPIEYPSEEWLLLTQEQAAHFDQYGTHKLWIRTFLHGASEGLLRSASYAVIISASLNMTVKKYKSVHEKIGGSGRLNDEARVSRSDIVGLSEAYSTEVRPMQFATDSDGVGLAEATSMLITRPKTVLENVGLLEAIQAKRTQGNLETTYTIDQLTQWSDISKVTTPWVRTVKVIP